MTTFAYEARERGGKKKKGTITAATQSAAIAELKKRGLIVLAVKEEKKTILHKEITFGRPVKNRDFVVFLRQFATLIRAGVGLVDSLHTLAAQTENKQFRKALEDIKSDIRNGIQLSEAAAKHSKIFEPLFLSMVKAGEASGNMEVILERLALFYEKSHYTKEKVKSAMTYPLVLLVLAIGVTVYLLTSVVPTFVGMFQSLNAELPAITKFVLAVSNSLVHYWYIYTITMLLLSIFSLILVKMEYGQKVTSYLKLKVPIFGSLYQKGLLARMSRTLSTLFSSSVPILQALTIVEEVMHNQIIGKALADAKESLRQGRPLSEPLKESWVFPPLVTRMIAIGEETGALETMLDKVADFYEAEVENTVDKVKALIEPIMIVVLAVLIGTIVISIMVPMFEMYSHIK
ncbi:type II secretion system F family protein [Aneurinibacillus thermoaerophilus]|uniref:Type II secretion system F family protein n=1 Tax=Aneurinibacillus thermoaerophilus TaxID=143495 RepID=A0A1G7ZSJ0_ANETH|nr:type II secretion system F family protein [Aneurinibacillus thermoaerophilus]MED0678910.1 type II secretion system F family protein [Aneurinibacillus thermoaerophilus]MED0736447.1 type II secretion system F family protein [Aneurinibacillus thermoaerophilus]MED0755950.1 type II secretion system F family protein [Aneurinibacillus thermoaerophilus]MED0759726.1 type II secretion system F family protein [Aneurinibacillus thermoaerophilus]MED0763110.1 type II secretion system F family protein [An